MLIHLDKKTAEAIYKIAGEEKKHAYSDDVYTMWKSLQERIKEGYERDFNKEMV